MRFPAPIATVLPALPAVAAALSVNGALSAVALPVRIQEPAFTQHDSIRTHSHARRLQARFERLRIREMPRIPDSDSQECDEVIGRLCVWDDGDDDWKPKEEAPEIGAARSELVAALDSLGALVPGDHWVFGQRIRYLAEAGDLNEAEALARRCGLPERWRCDAYLGYVHHRQTEFDRAEAAFRSSIEAMPDDVRRDWTSPALVLDLSLRAWLSEQPDSAAALKRLWMLADPLFLAEGNDRWTGHMSRWSYSMSGERARNPYGINWGGDFTEVVVRYGWPASWERAWPGIGQSDFHVVGRDLPAAFRTFPPRDVLGRGPSGVEPVVWAVPERHPRSTYLPPYLDSLPELHGQAGRFWRPGHVVVVGAWTAPGGDADAPGDSAAAPRDGADAQVLSGLFVEQGGEIRGNARTTGAPGSPVRLRTSVPWADWGTVSLEAWSPGARAAYRFRAGMGFRQLPPGLLAVSDLVFLEVDAQPASFDEMVDVLRSSTEVRAGEALRVAMEVYGLGVRPEAVGFRAWVERRDDGLLTRVGRWLGLAPGEVVSIAWRETGPRNPEPLFRTLAIAVPEQAEGAYDVVVEVSVRGRSPLAVRRGFTVR